MDNSEKKIETEEKCAEQIIGTKDANSELEIEGIGEMVIIF